MKDFFKYIKYPIPLEKTERFTFNIYLKTIGLCYALFIITSVLLSGFNYFILLPHYFKPEVSSLTIFLIITVLGPLFEEILCRLNLKISKLNIIAFIAALIIFSIKLLFFREIRLHLFVYIGTIIVFAMIYYPINRYYFSFHKIETFCKSNFKYIFHLFAISFGIMHLTNFETIYWWMIVISPLLIAPYISTGYVLGYIRMKYGFTYGWLIHSTLNFISVMLAIHKGIIVVLILTVVLLTTNYFIQKMKKSY